MQTCGDIQVKRYESDRILGLSVTINGSSMLFINVYFPVACHEKCEEYNMTLGILIVPYLNPMTRIINATPGSPRFNELNL